MKVYDSWDTFMITGRGQCFGIKDNWTLDNIPRPMDIVKIDQTIYKIIGVENCLVMGHDKDMVCPHPFRMVLVKPV